MKYECGVPSRFQPTALQQQTYDILMEKSVGEEEANRLATEYHAKKCVQMSSKYRTLAKLPDGESGVQALQRLDPEGLAELRRRAEEFVENQAKDHYLLIHAANEGNQFNLDLRTFKAFKQMERKRDDPET